MKRTFCDRCGKEMQGLAIRDFELKLFLPGQTFPAVTITACDSEVDRYKDVCQDCFEEWKALLQAVRLGPPKSEKT